MYSKEVIEKLEIVYTNNEAAANELYNFAARFANETHKTFTSDDIKAAFLMADNALPENYNAIGAVFAKLARNKVIYWHEKRMVPSSFPLSHGRLIRVYVSHAYRLKQQANATNKNFPVIPFES